MQNFWQQFNKPIFCLAPMEEVTDVAFREMFARYSSKLSAKSYQLKANDFVMFTEFINVDGLTHPEGYKKLSIDLKYTEAQRPIVAQIWGTNPEKFYQAAQIISKLGFDGIDINMGCPQDKEIGLGSCAALIKNPALAKQIISAVKKGAGGLPVSVKTRLGYSSKAEMQEWITHLLGCGLAAISVHARTKQEKSKVPADWKKIAEAVKLRNVEFKIQNAEFKTLIIGNGDIKSREEGLARVAETGCDGVMIGRGAFGNPWIFGNGNYLPSVKERLLTMLEHADLFEKWLPEKPFVIMRKHFKAYASGFDGASELRVKLMEAKDLAETTRIVAEYLKGF